MDVFFKLDKTISEKIFVIFKVRDQILWTVVSYPE